VMAACCIRALQAGACAIKQPHVPLAPPQTWLVSVCGRAACPYGKWLVHLVVLHSPVLGLDVSRVISAGLLAGAPSGVM
jgi:hypothetical protein